METKENNVLIAGFMGFITTENKSKGYTEYSAHKKGLEFYSRQNNGYRQGSWAYTVNSDELGMKFHESWDWLMPVVNRIFDVEMGGTGEYDDHINSIQSVLMWGDIEWTYKKTVDFIKWYNKRF